MKLIYAKKSYVSSLEKEQDEECACQLLLCGQLNLSCHEELGEYGVWLDIGECHLLIDPLDLFESISVESGIFDIDTIVEEGNKLKVSSRIAVVKEKNIYSWSLYRPVVKEYSRNYYWRDDYISLISSAIHGIYNVLNNGSKVAYKGYDILKEALDVCVKQCEIPSAFPSDRMLMTKDIIVENFVFDPASAEKCRIGIGNRGYDAYLLDRYNDFERIRHQLECISFDKKVSVCLYNNDMQEIIISFIKEDVLDEVKGAEDGYAFTYKDYLHVSIMAEDGYIPSIFGFCEVNKTIRTLYESLLWKAFLYPTEIKEYSQCNSMMTVYNKIKSPIIESFLTGKKDAKDCYAMRQVHIKSVLVINPDYDELICDETHLVIDDEELSRIVGGKFDVKGFYEWGREIHPIVIAAEFGEQYNMEWGDYHRRGLEFAKELRKCLPSEYDLWYHKPFEDNTCSIPERQLIM